MYSLNTERTDEGVKLTDPENGQHVATIRYTSPEACPHGVKNHPWQIWFVTEDGRDAKELTPCYRSLEAAEYHALAVFIEGKAN